MIIELIHWKFPHKENLFYYFWRGEEKKNQEKKDWRELTGWTTSKYRSGKTLK